jgi:hypothetical protein
LLPALFLLSGLSYEFGLFIAAISAPYRYGVYSTFCLVLGLILFLFPSPRRFDPASEPRLAS